MKIIGILFCLIIVTSKMYGQQFLWSTLENTSSKHVLTEDIISEVLEFYDHYKFYHDGAGYSKTNFLKTLEKYGDKSESWKSFKETILKIEKLTVFAIRGNTGEGSIVLVICVTKENVNFVSFSNNYESGFQMIIPMESERKKFSEWFETLLK